MSGSFAGLRPGLTASVFTTQLPLAIPIDLRRQLDKKFLHSEVTLIDGVIGVCRKMSFSLQEVDVTLRPVILVAKGIRAVPVVEVGGRRRKRHQRATRRPDLRSGH